jgi:1-acyl-sn-glycerol-3-phosphate acyltransferase
LPGAHRRFLARAVMATFGRLVTVEGAERLAGLPEPAVFALNHGNAAEALLAPVTLMHLRGGRPVHFLADWMYLHMPVIGWVIRLNDPIPVYRKPARWRVGEGYRRARLAGAPVLESCLARLAAGGSLGIFPEGTRNPDPERLLRGRTGLGEIVLRSAAPVVPVGIHYPAAARLGRVPRLGRMVLRIGEPLAFSRERAAAAGLDAAETRARLSLAREVVSRVMAALEELSGKTYSTHDLERRVA